MIANIQSLRAIAALIVVFSHIAVTGKKYEIPSMIFAPLEVWGASGVDIFFVISGFIMLYTQQKIKRSPFSFIYSRIIRIVPIYWMITIVFVASVYLLPRSTFNSEIPNITEIVHSLFFVSGSVTHQNHPVVYVGWTLEWEMLFYLIFGVSLLAKKVEMSALITAGLLTFTAIYLGNLIALEFVLGLAIAFTAKLLRPSRISGLIIALIGILGLSATLFWTNLVIGPRFIRWGIPAFLIVWGAVHTWQLKNNILLHLGNASYSIYLMQALAIPAVYKLVTKIDKEINPEAVAAIGVIATIATGMILHVLVEKKATSKLKTWLSPVPKQAKT